MSLPENNPTSFPVYEDGQWISLTDEAFRLCWTLQGPITTAVTVLDDRQDPEGSQSPCLVQTPSGLLWHPVAQAAFTLPRISSINVTVDQLDLWPSVWEDCMGDPEPGESGCVFTEPTDKNERRYLLKCMGSKRPPNGPVLTVMASSIGGYITIRDYVSAVHPWLLSLRPSLLMAMNLSENDDFQDPLPADTRLTVSYEFPSSVAIFLE
ncbi:hypothetical protein QQS21_001299 [Conoideocrella luteorostrata]|uniref:Uncharacterized protein n=1 Tax=Conoideocrella luteorostrata TaxID=1105319 RepID=A0AAJ0D0T2_9HYPO|nr:hypothetical protein QQS21_001299 [Conoideocrella luteorostrata]